MEGGAGKKKEIENLTCAFCREIGKIDTCGRTKYIVENIDDYNLIFFLEDGFRVSQMRISLYYVVH